jgi:two-component system, NarL family, response regulator NreC
MSAAKLKVFLADDHGILREGLKKLIDAEPDMITVGEASEGSEAVAGVARLLPDILIIDITMPGVSGVRAARQIHETCPSVKIIALTVHEDRSYLRELFDAGAMGYVVKRAAADELIRAIRNVAAGNVYVDPLLAGKVVAATVNASFDIGGCDITARETDVLRRIARGYSNKEIAAHLGISVKTVETYKARAMEKLGLRHRVDIVRLGSDRGWLQDE